MLCHTMYKKATITISSDGYAVYCQSYNELLWWLCHLICYNIKSDGYAVYY